MIETDYPSLLAQIKPYLAPKRSESASFLIWYLVNYYRQDELDAVDAVCDQSGDKGVDGIYLNHGAGTIDIFQSKISQNLKTIGDAVLKEFAGTLSQFDSKSKIDALVTSAKNRDIGHLITRLQLTDYLANYNIRGVFLSNSILDANGGSFLKNRPDILFVGAKELVSSYISDQKDTLKVGKAKFDISGFSATTYVADQNSKAIIAPVSARELVKLSGIQDQSLFALNVRASLGKTQVNRDIEKSIRDSNMHKMFPLFHNGITVLAKKVTATDAKIEVEDYFVVNGCQSLNALYHNKEHLTDKLRLLTKFIQVDAQSELSGIITAYSNNQNGVKARDFKSNDAIQIRIQNEFVEHYKNEFVYEIKRGEPLPKKGEIISNEMAGLALIAFDRKEPWTTHRKYQLFDERYSEVFGRPEVTADRIVFCHLLMKEIESRLGSLNNQLIAKYLLTKYAILYTLRKILETDSLGKKFITEPEIFTREKNQRARLLKVISHLLDGLMIDLNVETKDLDVNFDYREKLRDKGYVNELSNDLLATYQKDIARGKAQTLDEVWQKLGATKPRKAA